jgi:hypothetical protein
VGAEAAAIGLACGVAVAHLALTAALAERTIGPRASVHAGLALAALQAAALAPVAWLLGAVGPLPVVLAWGTWPVAALVAGGVAAIHRRDALRVALPHLPEASW